MTPRPQDIDAYLASLEYERDIAILGAWDAGSRAWGTESPASDYDLRFVYAKAPSAYPTTTNQTIDTDGTTLDTVSNSTDIAPRLIEMAGWDAGYFVELLCESNPSALEALHSPLPYRVHPVFEEMAEYMVGRFNVIELANHYRGMASRNYQKYIAGDRQDEQTVKRTLNVVRALMYADYVYETHEFPTLVFPEFLDEAPDVVLTPWELDDIQSLVDYKRAGDGDEHIGNRFETTIESRLDALSMDNIDPMNHTRESDEYASGDDLNEYMRTIVQNRLLTR